MKQLLDKNRFGPWALAKISDRADASAAASRGITPALIEP